jgi:hyperosmotically inducible periplasmic protein
MNNNHSKIMWPIFLFALVLVGGCYIAVENSNKGLLLESNNNNVLDIDVTNKVKMALMNDPVLKDYDIVVITTKGDVRLTGILKSQSHVNTVINIAKNTIGAHSIHDELSINI